MTARSRSAPPIRTVLLVTNLVVVCLPLLSLVVMRFYEDELIRRTETELYAQGAFVAETYRVALHQALETLQGGATEPLADYGIPVATDVQQARDAERAYRRSQGEAMSELRPIAATLSRRGGRIAPPAPSPDLRGEVDAAAAAAGRFIAPILDEANNVTLAGIRVVDFNGVEVATTRGDHRGWDLTRWSEVSGALRGEVVSQLRRRVSDEPRPALASPSRGTKVRVFVAMPIVEGERVVGAVVLSRTPLSLSKGLYNNRIPLFFVGLGLVLVVFMLSRFTSRTLARPMDRLVLQASQIARREPAGRAPMDRPGTEEARRVSKAMAVMATELEDREAYIRTFATSVSHEFKTPLTSMRGAIELLQDHWPTMSVDERERFLDVLESERGRLERLVRRVLELARADVARPGEHETDVAEVVQELADREGQVQRQLAIETVPAIVAMSHEAVDTVLSALVANARQHGGPEVAVDVARDAEVVRIAVSDDGTGVSDANAARIFESFFTTDREGGGTGVGLAIVRALCRSHGGDVVLRQLAGRTVFEVSLPCRGD